MKKIYKSVMLASSVGLLTVALASCGKNARNSSTPYGENDKYQSSEVIAKANGGYTMTKAQFYDRLRAKSYSLIEQEIKEYFYADEMNAVKEVILSSSPSELSQKTSDLIRIKKGDDYLIKDLNAKTLDPNGVLTDYEYIKKDMTNQLASNLSSNIYGITSAKELEKTKKADDKKGAGEIKTLETSLNKFIEAKNRQGIKLTKDILSYSMPTDDSDIVKFDHLNDLLTKDEYKYLVKTSILNQAIILSSKNALYQIADQEYIHQYDDEEDDEKTKNISYYLYTDQRFESEYESTYKTYGEYKIIVVQYNTRKEALAAMNSWDSSKSVLENYLTLYKNAHSYDTSITENSDCFTYEVNEKENELADLSNGIQNLIKNALEDGQYTKEPRNLDGKYAMVYRVSTKYDVSGTNEETSYDKLLENETLKNTYLTRIKYNLITNNASAYSTTDYNAKLYEITNNDIEEDDLRIYDPVFEYSFYSNNTDTYELIDKSDFNNNLVFSLGDKEYTVDDFYDEASKAYGTSILTEYFELEYAYSFRDEYVDEDTLTENKDTLTDAMNTFKRGKNDSYDKKMGMENYLLLNYGYKTKEEIIKYKYEAQPCLDGYLTKLIYEDWAKKNPDDSSKNIINTETVTILNNILSTGNSTYSTLFNIDLDHLLINVDYDGDGVPDDPEEFLNDKDPQVVSDFKKAVEELAQIIYTEANSGKYGDNSTYKVLTYIVDAYNQDLNLKSDGHTSETWAKYKKFNFMLTVEALASSGDITQDTVTNYVTSFADYVKKVYEKLSTSSINMDNYENGLFYIYDKANDAGIGLTTAADASKITVDTLCTSSFGYHLLIVNDYSGPKETKFEPTSGDTFQKSLSILLVEDEDDETNNIVVTVDSTNTVANAANINQLFVYYVQKANGTVSSLDEDIQSIMGTLFNDAISTYSSSNFQTYLLLNDLKIEVVDNAISNLKVDDRGIDTTYYANQVTNYGKNDKYNTWVDGTTLTWTRPEK